LVDIRTGEKDGENKGGLEKIKGPNARRWKWRGKTLTVSLLMVTNKLGANEKNNL